MFFARLKTENQLIKFEATSDWIEPWLGIQPVDRSNWGANLRSKGQRSRSLEAKM